MPNARQELSGSGTGKPLRIISGIHKGKRLQPFTGKRIRPTSDRLRESIFNILSDRVQFAVVLDIFAGTGALGIEALSRGAVSATFIEKDRAALSILRKNIQSCRLEDKANIIQWDVLKNLNCIRWATPRFNLVFIDPPYQKDMLRLTLQHVHNSQALKNKACLVVEHGMYEKIPETIEAFQLKDERKYGKTLVSFFEYMV
jgi:16S rRNA (guanine966-N2)-methyltransferase